MVFTQPDSLGYIPQERIPHCSHLPHIPHTPPAHRAGSGRRSERSRRSSGGRRSTSSRPTCPDTPSNASAASNLQQALRGQARWETHVGKGWEGGMVSLTVMCNLPRCVSYVVPQPHHLTGGTRGKPGGTQTQERGNLFARCDTFKEWIGASRGAGQQEGGGHQKRP